MYLARYPDEKRRVRFMIRQSYADGKVYRSRDVFDLGDDPSRFIVYPGGNAFYIDEAVEDAVADQGIPVSQDELESVFRPFLAPHILRVIDGFDRRRHCGSSVNEPGSSDVIHRFDRYRRQFLKLGRVVHREPKSLGRLYGSLQNKSRDEIEWTFITEERHLRADELAHYTYQIFDLQHYFSERFARSHPEGLDQARMDRYFVRSLCRLDQDKRFWNGSDKEVGLHRHLIRYAVMYFDNQFFARDPLRDFAREFMNRHRIHRPVEPVPVNLDEAAKWFGVATDTLKRMDRRTLTRRYRRLALRHHPDMGGDQATFVKLTVAYRQLLKRKT
ncbi:MAG: hypothetical protein WBY88_04605 [Desulfosarcina sp.]